MDDDARTTTSRLLLTRPTADDVDELHELHELMSDPRVWEHFPQLRHTDVAQTVALVEHQARRWETDGLGAWVVRGRTPDEDGALLGLGGCHVRDGVLWNLGYRLHRRAWGRGYAQEVIAAARAAAGRHRADLPVVAYLLEHNVSSRRAAERAGLSLVWRGPDEGNPDPAAVRLVLADRPLPPATLAAATT